MDNLTHTLIGAVAGETLARTCRARPGGLPDEARRRLFVVVGALGSNLPDIDLAWTYRGFSGSSLGYLLDHRGHTHTLVGCAALALLLQAAGLFWARWRGHPMVRGDHVALGGIAAFAVFGHLGMDALNSYGVHPFWPWNNRWYYGDSLFIVEPLYWLAALPLLFVVRTTLARVVLGAAALVALLATSVLQRAQPLHIIGVVVIAIALAVIGRRGTPRTAALAAGSAMLLLTGGFIAASHVAGERLRAMAVEDFPAATTLDTVMTPSPTNPGCWDVLLLQTGAGAYIARRGSLAIGVSPHAGRCSGATQGQGGLTPTHPVPAPTRESLHWTGEASMPEGRLAELARTDCAARELLQFARAPFAVEREGRWVLGDLRFDRTGGAGFATVELPPTLDSPCSFAAPWTPPRTDLLARGE
jgi:inner membrane protein